MELSQGRRVAFVCRVCGESIGDPAYRGPWGHAPGDVCFTCWVNAFEQPPWHWPREVLALWLLANGYNRTEAAQAVRMHRGNLWRLLQKVRKNFSEFLEIAQQFSELRANRRLKGGNRVR